MELAAALATLDGAVSRIASSQTPLWKKNRAALAVVKDALAARDAEIAHLADLLDKAFTTLAARDADIAQLKDSI